MSVTREEALVYINQYYTIAYDSTLALYDYQERAYQHYLAGEDHEAIGDICASLSWAGSALWYLVAKRTPFEGGYAVPYFLEHFAGGDINMGLILSTMLTATPDEVEYFIGLVDAYRSSIWQRPFNQDMYAALARGFKIWP